MKESLAPKNTNQSTNIKSGEEVKISERYFIVHRVVKIITEAGAAFKGDRQQKANKMRLITVTLCIF